MDTRRVLLALLAIVVAAGVTLVFLLAAPRLLSVEPTPGERSAPAGSPVLLRFSRSMDPASVIAHLSTDPPVNGSYAWQDNTLIFTPDRPWLPGVTVTVRLAAGARSSLRLPLLQGSTWSFRVGLPRVIYLWPASGPADLYALEPLGGEILRMTRAPHGVLDYSVTAQGAIYYSAANASGGTDLYRLARPGSDPERVLKCPRAVCRNPTLSPQGDLLAYQQMASAAGETGPAARVQLLRLEGGQPAGEMTVADLNQPSEVLDWSSGELLVYYDSEQSAFIFYNLERGTRVPAPNRGGQPGSWSPDGNVYVAPEILIFPGLGAIRGEPANPSHLMRYSPTSGQADDLSRQVNLADGSPAYSPDGGQIVLARKFLDQPRLSLGSQIWAMNADGTGARPLTDDPAFNHTEFAWSPDGSQIVYMRFNQTTLTDPPEIWLMDAEGREAIRLVIGGYDPQWTP